MGRGIVEPVDDVRISNPASNPELLDALAKKIIEYNYDLRHIVRDICTSRTYQPTTRAERDQRARRPQFRQGHHPPHARRGACSTASPRSPRRKEKFRGLPLGARAVQIADGKTTNYFLTTFGRSDRENICTREEVGPTLSQALHLLNGDTIEDKINEGGVVKKLMTSNKTPREIVRNFTSAASAASRPTRKSSSSSRHWGVTEEQPAGSTTSSGRC